MTILEAGIIAGVFGGAAVGARLGGQEGLWIGVGGVVAGVLAGGVSGWVFAMLLLILLSFVDVVWRAARKRGDDPLSASDMDAMTPVAVAGTFVSALMGLAVLAAAGWRAAIGGMIASACVTAFMAVARCELRKSDNYPLE